MKRIFWGMVFIALGVLALLQGTGAFNFGLSFWPVVLTLIGLGITYDSLTKRRGPSWFGLALGLWLGSMGLFTILHDAGVTPQLSGSDIAQAGWPLLMIALGFALAFGKGVRVLVGSSRHRGWNGDRHQVVGDLRYGREHWVLDKDLNLTNSVGDLKVDLTTADITPGIHRITVTQFVGETVVKVPDNVTVRVTAEANVGELDILGDHRSGAGLFLQKEILVPESDIELIIDAQLRVGSLRVVRLPVPSQRVIG
ncbi:MAG: LiaF domain-containing protein [Bacillota bacterium]